MKSASHARTHTHTHTPVLTSPYPYTPVCPAGKGETALDYVGCGAPCNSGYHRYIWLLFKQTGKVSVKKTQKFFEVFFWFWVVGFGLGRIVSAAASCVCVCVCVCVWADTQASTVLSHNVTCFLAYLPGSLTQGRGGKKAAAFAKDTVRVFSTEMCVSTLKA